MLSGIAVNGTAKIPPETTPANEMDDEQSSGFAQLVGEATTVTDEPSLNVPVTTGVVTLVLEGALWVAVIG